MRGSSASLPSRAAASSASMSHTPSADHTSATVFGPMPGSRSSSSIVGLYLVSSSARIGIVPVATSSQIFAAIPLPIPGIASNCLGSDTTSAASCVVCCSTASAARRYERIRNGSAASISSSAAVSSEQPGDLNVFHRRESSGTSQAAYRLTESQTHMLRPPRLARGAAGHSPAPVRRRLARRQPTLGGGRVLQPNHLVRLRPLRCPG